MWSEVPPTSAAFALRQRGFWVQDGAVENELATELREEILRCHEDPRLGVFFWPPCPEEKDIPTLDGGSFTQKTGRVFSRWPDQCR